MHIGIFNWHFVISSEKGHNYSCNSPCCYLFIWCSVVNILLLFVCLWGLVFLLQFLGFRLWRTSYMQLEIIAILRHSQIASNQTMPFCQPIIKLCHSKEKVSYFSKKASSSNYNIMWKKNSSGLCPGYICSLIVLSSMIDYRYLSLLIWVLDSLSYDDFGICLLQLRFQTTLGWAFLGTCLCILCHTSVGPKGAVKQYSIPVRRWRLNFCSTGCVVHQENTQRWTVRCYKGILLYHEVRVWD